MKKILINHLILQAKEQLKKKIIISERKGSFSWLENGVATSCWFDKPGGERNEPGAWF